MNKEMLSAERERLEVLLDRKVLTGEEMEEVKENSFVVNAEYLGYSADYSNCYWYDVEVLDQGYLPEDDEYTTTRYNVYEKIESQE